MQFISTFLLNNTKKTGAMREKTGIFKPLRIQLKRLSCFRSNFTSCHDSPRLLASVGSSCDQARSQDLEKGGGYFERVRSVQTTLTRIFIDLESVSDGLSEI